MNERWTVERAWAWYRSRSWMLGFNYVPSSAVNTTEFWSAETFDPETIERELGWAADIGFNGCRVFLQYLVHAHDPTGHLERLDRFLEIAHRHGLSTMFVLFDDCAFAGKQPYLGLQDEPVPGLHNSGWTPSPGHDRVRDQSSWPDLERYVREVIRAFANDPRVSVWDLYNEPGNGGMGDKSLGLLEASFGWARACSPTQPLTVGVWNPKLDGLNRASLEGSDVVSFHSYEVLEPLRSTVEGFQQLGRPLLCTEWLRRSDPLDHREDDGLMGASAFETHLPYFLAEGVGAYQWGLVNGKTQTHIPWGSRPGAPEPEIWFHDLLRSDGAPYGPEEIETIRHCLRDAGETG